MATRPYEIMFIVDSTLDDQVVQTVINRTVDAAKGVGATVGRVEKWGRRKLAYPINKKPDGYYTIVEMTCEPASIAELNRQMYLADEILRHKIMQVPQEAAGRSMAAPPPLDEIASGGGKDKD